MSMYYAALKAVHLLSLVAWVGGMYFALTCLRPALAPLDGPLRLRLMTDVLGRFFRVVAIAIGLLLVSGTWMLWSAMRVSTTRGLAFNMPLDWLAMITLGVVMIAVFGHIRVNLYRRLQRAVQAQDWPAGAVVHGRIRTWVTLNLVIGVLVIVVMRLGAAG